MFTTTGGRAHAEEQGCGDLSFAFLHDWGGTGVIGPSLLPPR
jgi:hypothetical protein